MQKSFLWQNGINAFLRQIPTFVNIDNLLVAIRGKCIDVCCKHSLLGQSRSARPLAKGSQLDSARPPTLGNALPTRKPPRDSVPAAGAPRHGDVAFLNCNLFRKSRVLLHSTSQLLSLRKTSWEQICISYDILLHQQLDAARGRKDGELNSVQLSVEQSGFVPTKPQRKD